MPLDEEEKVLLCSMRSAITSYSDWSSLSGQLERKLLTLGSMWHVRRGETRELVLVLSKTHVAELVWIKLDGCAACGQSFLLCGRRAGAFLQIQPRGCACRTGGVCVPRSHHNHAEFWPGEAERVYTVCYRYRPGTGTADRRVSDHRPYCWHQWQWSQVWEQSLSVWVFLNYLSQYCSMNLFKSSF